MSEREAERKQMREEEEVEGRERFKDIKDIRKFAKICWKIDLK